MKTFVGAIIEHPAHGFLLQKRDNNTDYYPNMWTIFGGKVVEGESVKEALFRELYEELEFGKNQVLKLKKFLDHVTKNGQRQVVYHIITNAEVEALVIKEGDSFGYFRKDEVFDRDFAFNIREVLESFFSTN